ncbi:MAG TPA: septum formation initiator family protein [Pseudolysinimonas sp.]|jgi:cell division protein FtsB|nr:septum formation initiator family protein [Pseudolysinimonas sp.]
MPRARRIPVALPEEGRPAAWLRNFRFSWFTLSVLGLIVAALLVLAAPLKELVLQRQQIADLQASIDQAQQDVDDLNAQVARWSDPAYIQAQARERLYYILPGDISYLIVGQPQGQSSQGDLPISDEIQTTQTDWIGGLLGSVYTAGLTDETPAQLDSPAQVDSPQQSDSGTQ